MDPAPFARNLANAQEKPEPEPAAMELTHIVTGGEPGGGIPAIRDHIQTVLCATVTEEMRIVDIAPSLFGQCPQQEWMHFCGDGHHSAELVDPESREPMMLEARIVGALG